MRQPGSARRDYLGCLRFSIDLVQPVVVFLVVQSQHFFNGERTFPLDPNLAHGLPLFPLIGCRLGFSHAEVCTSGRNSFHARLILRQITHFTQARGRAGRIAFSNGAYLWTAKHSAAPKPRPFLTLKILICVTRFLRTMPLCSAMRPPEPRVRPT